MASKDETKIGGLAIRYLVEGHEAKSSVAMFEFDVAPGGKVPALRATTITKRPPTPLKA